MTKHLMLISGNSLVQKVSRTFGVSQARDWPANVKSVPELYV